VKEGIVSKHIKERMGWLKDELHRHQPESTGHIRVSSRIKELDLLLAFIEGVNEQLGPRMEGYH